ncbi:cell division protein FtsB [Mangrovitalea sediminis]|uniref:cell division protein FtsB n=1 Tax=Mangrovitalea sediminis TaxID=1982043 RepID=UPI000BE608C5|nr:cell division protein FtsB [Mangrovitalea sediminis]
MKWLWTVLVLLIVLLQVRLWVGEGSFAQVWQLHHQIAEQQVENNQLSERNARLLAEVDNLRQGKGAIEERARMNLGMIRRGETFFWVVNP